LPCRRSADIFPPLMAAIAPLPPSGNPDLGDPATCGEDLLHNAQRAIDLARRLCRDCADYHVLFPLRRATGGVFGVDRDRPKMTEIVGQLVATRTSGPIDILIVGAADSGILATCAHAARQVGGDALRRARFTVIDRCETPLELCRDFARRHGLLLHAEAADLTQTPSNHTADVIVHHSLLRFLPPAARCAALRKLAQWLKPDGRLVFFMGAQSRSTVEQGTRRRAEVGALVRALVDSGRIRLSEPVAAFQARLDADLERNTRRQIDSSSPDDLRELFAAAGLQVASFEQLSREMVMPSGRSYARERIVAVLTRA
jgi:hypothetical protein